MVKQVAFGVNGWNGRDVVFDRATVSRSVNVFVNTSMIVSTRRDRALGHTLKLDNVTYPEVPTIYYIRT